jgi:hypothetical protein
MAEAIESALRKHGFIEDGHPFLDSAIRREDCRTAGVSFDQQIIEVRSLSVRLPRTIKISQTAVASVELRLHEPATPESIQARLIGPDFTVSEGVSGTTGQRIKWDWLVSSSRRRSYWYWLNRSHSRCFF